MTVAALHRLSAGGTRGTTRSRKTPHRGTEEVGFSRGLSAHLVAGLIGVLAVLAPGRSDAAHRRGGLSATGALSPPPEQGGADPRGTSQVQHRRAGTCRDSFYTYCLFMSRLGDTGRHSIDAAGSTLASRVSGPKNGVRAPKSPGKGEEDDVVNSETFQRESAGQSCPAKASHQPVASLAQGREIGP
jgi:hypothetical protein